MTIPSDAVLLSYIRGGFVIAYFTETVYPKTIERTEMLRFWQVFWRVQFALSAKSVYFAGVARENGFFFVVADV